MKVYHLFLILFLICISCTNNTNKKVQQISLFNINDLSCNIKIADTSSILKTVNLPVCSTKGDTLFLWLICREYKSHIWEFIKKGDYYFYENYFIPRRNNIMGQNISKVFLLKGKVVIYNYKCIEKSHNKGDIDTTSATLEVITPKSIKFMKITDRKVMREASPYISLGNTKLELLRESNHFIIDNIRYHNIRNGESEEDYSKRNITPLEQKIGSYLLEEFIVCGYYEQDVPISKEEYYKYKLK